MPRAADGREGAPAGPARCSSSPASPRSGSPPTSSAAAPRTSCPSPTRRSCCSRRSSGSSRRPSCATGWRASTAWWRTPTASIGSSAGRAACGRCSSARGPPRAARRPSSSSARRAPARSWSRGPSTPAAGAHSSRSSRSTARPCRATSWRASSSGTAAARSPGAQTDHPGLFVAAHRGTLFLDEIGELPLEAQAKLLRVLQDGEVRPVGGLESRKVDVRIIAASNRSLAAMGAGAMRQDLFFRLSVLVIEMPPLRERRDDLPLLVAHFLARIRERGVARVESVDPQALELLLDYPFPGNVRELENMLEGISLTLPSDRTTIRAEDVRGWLRHRGRPSTSRPRRGPRSGSHDLEVWAITEALRQTEGQQEPRRPAARHLARHALPQAPGDGPGGRRVRFSYIARNRLICRPLRPELSDCRTYRPSGAASRPRLSTASGRATWRSSRRRGPVLAPSVSLSSHCTRREADLMKTAAVSRAPDRRSRRAPGRGRRRPAGRAARRGHPGLRPQVRDELPDLPHRLPEAQRLRRRPSG